MIKAKKYKYSMLNTRNFYYSFSLFKYELKIFLIIMKKQILYSYYSKNIYNMIYLHKKYAFHRWR